MMRLERRETKAIQSKRMTQQWHLSKMAEIMPLQEVKIQVAVTQVRQVIQVAVETEVEEEREMAVVVEETEEETEVETEVVAEVVEAMGEEEGTEVVEAAEEETEVVEDSEVGAKVAVSLAVVVVKFKHTANKY